MLEQCDTHFVFACFLSIQELEVLFCKEFTALDETRLVKLSSIFKNDEY